MTKSVLGHVDITKFLFAVGIVAIHSGCFAGNDLFSWTIMHGVLRLAVPFFFCAAGYFFYKSLKKSNNIKVTTQKYIKRLLIPFVFWLTINLPVVVVGYLNDGNSIIKILLKLMRDLVFYPWGAMWFVSALIVAVLLIVPFYKKHKLKKAVVIGLVLYLVGLVFNTYYFVVHGTPLQGFVDAILQFAGSMRNGVFEGMFFVSIGMYTTELQSERRINRTANMIVLFISYILLLVEVILVKDLLHADDSSLFVAFIAVIPCLFLFLSELPTLKIDTKPFRNYSTGVYFSHRFFLAIIMFLLKPYNSVIGFALTFSIAMVVLTILYKIDNEKINYVIR